jgi:hypothetical protein
VHVCMCVCACVPALGKPNPTRSNYNPSLNTAPLYQTAGPCIAETETDRDGDREREANNKGTKHCAEDELHCVGCCRYEHAGFML